MAQKTRTEIFLDVVRTLVVIAGGVVAYREFALTDRADERERRAAVHRIAERDWGVRHKTMELARQICAGIDPEDAEQHLLSHEEDVAQLYGRLLSCVDSGGCDASTAQDVFCPHATAIAYRYFGLNFERDELLDEWLPKRTAIVDLAVIRFASECPNPGFTCANDEQKVLGDYSEKMRSGNGAE